MVQLETESYSISLPTLFAYTCMASVRRNANMTSLLHLLCLFLSSHSSSQLSHATDTLIQGQSLPDGQTLVSAGGIFELGFFTPGDSTRRYVGIWHHGISPPSAVWVANRDHPLPDSSGIFTVGSDGNILVVDRKSNTIWSSNASITVPNNSVAQLTDAGNFVLNNTGDVVWQSFDHPTDTYLPGMKIGLDLTTGASQVFTSWRSDDDASPGSFSLGVDPRGSTQLFIWEGLEPYWRSGLWNGISLIGIPNKLYLDGFKLNHNDKMYYSYTPSARTLVRFKLRWDGTNQCLIWSEDTKAWNPVLSIPSGDGCDIYNRCGSHGVCSYSDGGTLVCSCLRGFEPRHTDEWKNGNWSGGCIRRTPLMCGRKRSNGMNSTKMDLKGDGFLRLDGMKLPDLSNGIANYLYESVCEDGCLKNCSCMAYAFIDGSGCFVWDQELVDLYQFRSGGYPFYLRLAGSELDERSSTFKIVILAASLGAVILATFTYILWRWKKRAKDHWKRESEREMLLFDLGLSEEVATDILGSKNSRESNRRKVPELVSFDFNTLSAATSNFCDSNKLGEGGFGPVYKGKLPDGREVAVKRLSKSSGQGLEEFKNEVTLIAKLQHRNLVRLLGCCIQGEEKILLYEYMPNKSLDAFLFGSTTKQMMLDWGSRFCIIQGIARGLLYLHEDSRLRIVHRDLKISNILLDGEMNPKISDFGIARIFGGDQNEASTKRVVGTYGYMSPEYAMKGMFSMKSDVYSFGVILLEIVSGKKNNTFYHDKTSQTLLNYAWQLWNEGNAEEFIDPSLKDTCSQSEALRCIQVGLLCVQDRPNDRPTMSFVVLMLGCETSIQAIPDKPTFMPESRSGFDPSMNNLKTFTNNDVTITMLMGR